MGKTQIGGLAVLLLVALRLTTGWHFFKEGAKKLHDPGFTSAYFLQQAKGPLADYFQGLAASESHGWDKLLAQPRRALPPSDEELAARAKWQAERAAAAKEVASHNAELKKKAAEKEASKEAETDSEKEAETDADKDADKDAATEGDREAPLELERVEIVFPPYAPYAEWGEQVVTDWRGYSQAFQAACRLTPAQQREMGDIFYARHQQLADYLEAESDAIADYRHELSRLRDWEENPTADDVPYQQGRIAAKRAEIAGMAGGWQRTVEQFEEGLQADLVGLLDDKQRAASTPPPASGGGLTRVNRTVTWLTLGVGVCLVLGLFTRLAAVAGAVFLLSVIATQPPWVAGAQPVYYQAVELVALLLLAATAAGRWAGLDFFTHALFTKCCGAKT